MPGKSDPLNQRATLWLDRDANEIACERYFRAWFAQERQVFPGPGLEPNGFQRAVWDTAWAAAVAVHSFITEGRLGPPVDDDDGPD